MNFHVFLTGFPGNIHLFSSIIDRENQLWETLPFDLKNSCLLKVSNIDWKSDIDQNNSNYEQFLRRVIHFKPTQDL